MSQHPDFKLVSVLGGSRVSDSQGEFVGSVDDFLIDMTEARIAYVVISLHRPGDTAGRTVTVPWSAVSLVHQPRSTLRVAARRRTLTRLADSVTH